MKTKDHATTCNMNPSCAMPRRRPEDIFGFVTPLLLWLLSAGGAAQAQCFMRPTNIVAWWPGDGHAYDVVNVRVAALQNGAGYAPGTACQAFHFAGSNQKVRIPNNAYLRQTNRWTIEAWVRADSFSNATFPTLYSEGGRTVSLGLNQGTGKLESWINANSANTFVSTTALMPNYWHHVALVRDGAIRTFYIDGVAAGSTSATPATTAGAGGAAIGHDTPDGPDTAFEGDIDELSLYNRALRADEILGIYNAGIAGKCLSSTNPTFLIQPLSQTAYLGTNVVFSALAHGSPCVTYQWRFNGKDLDGQTGSTLTLTDLTFANEGDYAVVAKSGSDFATSTVAHLTVRFCTDSPAGLVAWWPGDGSGLEATGIHHGAPWGNISYPEGIAGQAFGFNGTDAYVAVPDSPELSPHAGSSGEMTVETWVYLTQLPQTDPFTGQNRRVVLGKGDSTRWEYALCIDTAGTIEFFVWPLSGTSYCAKVSGGQIILNQWHHLVGVLKKAEFTRLYQDSQLMAESTTFGDDSADGGSPLYIGRRGDGQFFNGLVDEAALYSRALDVSEIKALYDSGAFGKCSGAASPAPFFAVQPASTSGYQFLSASLSALALGTPRPDYQWFRSNAPTTWEAILDATNATLSLTALDASVAGFYRVTATNIYGGATSQPAWLDVVCHPLVCSTNGYGEDFEDGWNGWTADNWIWQVGVPHSGPGGAHHGTCLAATVLDGNYPDDATSRLVSPPFVVPALEAQPRLRFWHWWSFNCDDYGQVQIKEVDGDWQPLSGQVWGDSYGIWTRAWLDLSTYAGQTVQLRFNFYSHNNYDCNWPNVDVGPGWYVDEVLVETGPPPSFPLPGQPEGFEGGWGGWQVDYIGGRVTDFGIWEIGRPTSGPGGAHSGSSSAATVLGGNYQEDRSARLVSPAFVVPPAEVQPRLRFWHWWSFNCDDYGQVQISTDSGGSWKGLSSGISADSYGYWTRAWLDLSAYAGQTVQLGFYFYSHNNYDCNWPNVDVAPGWYVDDLVVETGPPPSFPLPGQPEGFEGGWGAWQVDYIGGRVTDFGIWEIGRPTSGPGGAHSGSSSAATVLGGNYQEDRSARLVSPAFVVPPTEEQPRLRFWHWWSFNCDDYGQVQISTDNGGSWKGLSSGISADSYGYWTRAWLDLGAYAGQTVQLGFYFYSHNNYDCSWPNVDVAPGWYVDDLVVETGPPPSIPLPGQPEGFEGGWGGWQVDYIGGRVTDFGIWEIGRPTSGPGGAHSGSSCAATVLGGNYQEDRSARLVSPAFVVPPAEEQPRLRFWHWWSFNCDDYGRVQLLDSNGWHDLSQQFAGGGGGWTASYQDLAPYAGQTVQLGFYFYSHNNYDCNWPNVDVAPGWYVEDLFIKRGNVTIVPIPDKTIAETNCLTFPVNVVGANASSILSFSLGDGTPAGAEIDPGTGVFSWCPAECQGPGTYRIPIYVVDYGNDEANDLGFVTITVNEVNEPPGLLDSTHAVVPNDTLQFTPCYWDVDCPRNPLKFELVSGAPPGATIDASTGVFKWTPTTAQLRDQPYVMTVRLCDNGTPNYCVSKTITVAVTTNTICELAIRQVVADTFEFTIPSGRTDRDYVLEGTSTFCVCPCQTEWQPILPVRPTTMPFSFTYQPPDLAQEPVRFFRLKEVLR